MTSSEIQLDTPGGIITAKAWGDASAPKLLALHGWLDNAATFDRLAPLIKNVYFVAIDLPGHGRSYHRPPNTAYHFIDWIGDVVDSVKALQWNTFTLLGHSLGGGIGAIFTSLFPEQVEQLVLLESLGPLTDEPKEAPGRARDYFRQKERLSTKSRPAYRTIEEMERLRHQAGNLLIESAKILTARNIEKSATGFTWASDPRLRLPSPIRLTEPQVISFFERIESPVLVVAAKQGLRFDPKVTEARLQALKTHTLVQIDGHHHFHLDKPAPCAQAVNDFLGAVLTCG